MSEDYNEMLKNNIDLEKASLPTLTPPDNNANQYNITKEMTIHKEKGKCDIIWNLFGMICFIIILFIVLFNLIKYNVSIFAIIFILIMIIILIVAAFLFLYLNVKHIKLIKNEAYNLLSVEEINLINFPKSTLNFNLNNVILDIIKYQISDEDVVFDREALVIANTFKNDKDIDLNISDIKNKPIKETYHVFPEIKQNIYYTASLRNFIGISPEIENPTKFNINKYMGNSNDIYPTFSSYKLSRYMKMSDYFFSYYFIQPCCYCGFKCLIITMLLTVIIIAFPITTIFIYDNVDVLVTVILIIVMLVIPSIIEVFNIIAINKYSLRMDIIYSKNFDTIFIAFLNHNGNSYKKTFMHNINSIERFIIESYNNSNDQSILKVEYKDKSIEVIFRMDEGKYNLEGLLFILNEKLNNSN